MQSHKIDTLLLVLMLGCSDGKQGILHGLGVPQVNYEELKCDLKQWLDGGWQCKNNCTVNELDMDPKNGQGPLIVRLAWHCSGTYDSTDGTGGCDGARVRFKPESTDPDNAGLQTAVKQLDSFLSDYGPYNGLSYADLYTLAGAVAVENMGGEVVPWRPGRLDATTGDTSPENGRLPQADRDAAHVRDVFTRLGFNESQTVALIGAHTLGCAHKENSGFDGCWVQKDREVLFDNEFFRLLKFIKYVPSTVPETSKDQFVMDSDESLIMLPTDMALLKFGPYKEYVDLYASDNQRFLKDFSAAYSQLLERGARLQGTKVYDQPLAKICAKDYNSNGRMTVTASRCQSQTL